MGAVGIETPGMTQFLDSNTPFNIQQHLVQQNLTETEIIQKIIQYTAQMKQQQQSQGTTSISSQSEPQAHLQVIDLFKGQAQRQQPPKQAQLTQLQRQQQSKAESLNGWFLQRLQKILDN